MVRMAKPDYQRRIEDEARRELDGLAWGQAALGCCEKDCLMATFKDRGKVYGFVFECLNEVNRMDRREKLQYMMDKINECIVDVREKSGYAKMKWKVGAETGRKVEVCDKAFRNCYKVGHDYVETIVKALKAGAKVAAKDFNDRTAGYSDDIAVRIVKEAAARGYVLSHADIAMTKIPNSYKSLACYVWMHNYFDLVGDQAPNSGGEIHLDPTTKEEIYTEYVMDMESVGEERLDPSNFRDLWKTCFPHVKIKEFKNVTGKCDTCAALTAARKKYRDKASREMVQYFHAMHRIMFMSERKEYYLRRHFALFTPSTHMSIISDGMAQNHCKLPWMANQQNFGADLPQHLQGVLNHGREFVLYRTFANVLNDSNMQAHCFLLSIESILEKEGSLPDTVYYQIDGGSENTAKMVIALCELLVARRLTKKVVLTRLPVGHTHEDIDARFGVLWQAMRNRPIHTPQEYRKVMRQAFGGKIPVRIVDLWVIPDYTKLIDAHIDAKFGRYCRNEWTQLQFTMEAVKPSSDFPLGVKTTYRMYCCDEVIEVLRDPQRPVGLTERLVEVKTYPEAKLEADENGPARPEGMYILRSLPDLGILCPLGFVKGSRALLDSTVNRARHTFTAKEDIQEWEAFSAVAPQSDSVREYLEANPEAFYIPLKDRLFPHSRVDGTRDLAPVICRQGSREPPVRHVAQPSVKWSNRGDRCEPCKRPTVPLDPNVNDPSGHIIARARKTDISSDITEEGITPGASVPKSKKKKSTPNPEPQAANTAAVPDGRDGDSESENDNDCEPLLDDATQISDDNICVTQSVQPASLPEPVPTIEQKRLNNMVSNQAFLESIGISTLRDSLGPKPNVRVAKRPRPTETLEPSRKSSRDASAKASASIAQTAQLERTGRGLLISNLPDWEIAILSKSHPPAEEVSGNCKKLLDKYKDACFVDDEGGDERIVLDVVYAGTISNVTASDKVTERNYRVDLPEYHAVTDYVHEDRRSSESREPFIIDRDGDFNDLIRAYKPEGRLNKYEAWEKEIFSKKVSQKDSLVHIDSLRKKYVNVCFTDEKVVLDDGSYATEERIILDVSYSKGKFYVVDTDLVDTSKRITGSNKANDEGTRQLYYFDNFLHGMIKTFQTKYNVRKLY